MSARIVCGDDGVQRTVVPPAPLDGTTYWWVHDTRTGEALLGGFSTAAEAEAEARRLGTLDDA